MAILLRRRKLGNTSCREIAKHCEGVVVVRNDLPIPAGHDTLIRWGCTSRVDIKNVINTVEAIHTVNNKLGFRRLLNVKELCPMTWFSFKEYEEYVLAFVDGRREALEMMAPSVVVRPSKHAQGRNLHVCKTWDELKAACNRYPEYYISELIPKVAEYRVFVVQGRVACVAQKTPGNPDQVAWNVAQGGRFDNVRWDSWPLQAVKTSIEAFNLSGLDFGGVDVMVTADGHPYILEINSAPSLTSEYRQQCMGKCIDYMLKHGKKPIPITEAKGGYLKFVHPAVCDRARVGG